MGASTAALAVSVIALNESNNIKSELCGYVLNKYTPNTATVAEMKQYAECVDLKHPDNLSADYVIALKVIFLIAVISFFVGIIKEYKKGYNDIVMNIMYGFLCAIGVPLFLIIILYSIYGVFWVFGFN